MRKIIFAVLACVAVSCQESIEDRAAREAREYTEKNCPMQVSEFMTTDSMTFDKATRTLHYYYTLNGRLDTTAFAQNDVHADMLNTLRSTPGLKVYKEAQFNFKYTFTSFKNKGKVLNEVNISAKELQ